MAANSLVIQTVNDITVATVDDVSVVDGAQIDELKHALFDLIDNQDKRKLVLNLTKVRHLSSAALGLLIPLNEKYKKAKGKLVIAGVSPTIMNLFTITRLHKILTIAETESDALKKIGR
jgi:anti-anti-sigma factor